MKKVTTFTLFIFLFSFQLLAQDVSEKIPHDIKYGSFDFVGLPGGEFIFAQHPDNKIFEIRRYDKDFNVITKSTIKGGSDYNFSYEFVSSPNAEFIYLLQTIDIPTTRKIIYRINSEPELIKNETINKLKYVTMVFAGKTYLYYLSLDEDVVKLYAIDHSTQKGKTIVPKLSKQESGRYCTGWRYAGHDSKNIYISSKTVDFSTNVYLYKVAILDAEGVVQKEFELKGSPKDCIYPSSAYNNYPNNWSTDPGGVYNDGHMTFFNIHNYSGITIDTINKAVYITGSQGKCNGYMIDKQGVLTLKFGFQNHFVTPGAGSSLTGMFVHKFDFEGKKQWEYNLDFPADFVAKITASMPYGRDMFTRMTADSKNIEVAQSSSEKMYGYMRQIIRINLISDGQLANKSELHYPDCKYGVFDCNEKIIKANGMAGLKVLDGFEAFQTGSGIAVGYFAKKDKAIKLQFFKN